jgi:hypothetical protein
MVSGHPIPRFEGGLGSPMNHVESRRKVSDGAGLSE